MKTKRLSVAPARLIADPERFQIRRGRYAESIAANIARVGWIDAKGGEFHVWQQRERYFILDGHSRLEGIMRLDEADRPKKVRCVLHLCAERSARRIAKEMNASRADLLRTEKARGYREALDEDLDEHPVEEGVHRFHEMGHRYQRIADRFAGSTVAEIERDIPLAWLGEHAAYLTDNDLMPLSAARSLGRFLRRTEISSQQGDELASAYMKSGFSAHQFGGFLQEAEGAIVEAKQADMFGEVVERKLEDAKGLVRDLKRARDQLRVLRQRVEVFEGLEDTVWRPTKQQQELLKLDRENIAELEAAVSSKSKRLQLSKMLNGGGTVA